MASALPDNPSLPRLRADARMLQRRARAGDAEAEAVIRRHHPRPDLALQRVALHDAQLALARRYGFPGWPALVHYLEAAGDLSVDPSGIDETALDAAGRFCALAVLTYTTEDAPPRWTQAADILTAVPTVPDQHVWAAAAAFDVDALRRHLSADAASACSSGGPLRWPPLMYLCYSRVPVDRTADDVLAAATLLLDAGADPNAGYLWRGMTPSFTALTGAFGEGEQGPGRQPRHRQAPDLAALLLRRGAHPADHQALYNRMFRPDDSHLEVLFDHGVADADPSPWERRLGVAMESRDQMWRRQVQWAAEHGFADRLALLERHGIDVSGVHVQTPVLPDDPNARDESGATPLHHAAWAGDLPLIERLLAAGADLSAVDGRFGTTPRQWAEYAYQTDAAALLSQRAAD
ncbi:MAG: ankyrin repeat domain-containing protein [Mycobacterium kyogaense]|uniref:ankyrin repeat domain-containing protein n=1 Tax=Mycobacterium kyogaense TaxID=2212479 RepID=UPI002FF5A44D